MTLLVVSRRTSHEKIQRLSGDVHILDVTSRGRDPWRRFSPFYPHGGIPVPFSPGQVSAGVEGIWQVFAALTVGTLSTLILYVFLQRWFIQGLTAGVSKG